MKPSIKTFDPEQEFYISEGCFVTELSNSSRDPDLSIARARVKPGITTRWHRIKQTVERYVIIQGQGKVEVGDLPATEIKAGDTVVIPALCRQRITNTGSGDLVFLAICTPRFSPAAYEDVEPEQGTGSAT